jgi:hypothetical protein
MRRKKGLPHAMNCGTGNSMFVGKKFQAVATWRFTTISHYLIPLALLLLAGCSIVPTDTGWPKPVWYWSYQAKQYRAEKQTAKEWKAKQKELEQAQTNKPVSAIVTGDTLVEKIRKRDGTNFLGVYMGMIAEWDGWTSRYHPPTNYLGGLRFADEGWMESNAFPQGVMMFSATSGQLLKWISAEDFTNIFVLKTQPEYPSQSPK